MNRFVNLSRLGRRALLNAFAGIKDAWQALDLYLPHEVLFQVCGAIASNVNTRCVLPGARQPVEQNAFARRLPEPARSASRLLMKEITLRSSSRTSDSVGRARFVKLRQRHSRSSRNAVYDLRKLDVARFSKCALSDKLSTKMLRQAAAQEILLDNWIDDRALSEIACRERDDRRNCFSANPVTVQPTSGSGSSIWCRSIIPRNS
jgi:hypothetical protein